MIFLSHATNLSNQRHLYFTNGQVGCIMRPLSRPRQKSTENRKGTPMETTLEQRLSKLLDAYSHTYDIDRDVTVEDTVYPAMAT